MPEVKVRRTGISADEAEAAIRASLGSSVKITHSGDHRLDVATSFFTRAKVEMAEEPGGTVFAVHGVGVPFPLVFIVTKVSNEKGIAVKVADAIGASEGLRDND
jgi:hypothetical protein